jgi:hypothetical protein
MEEFHFVKFETTFQAADYELAFSLTSMTNGQLWIGTSNKTFYEDRL